MDPATQTTPATLTTLARIDDGLGSAEIAALCFLCRDELNKKALETVTDGRDLFYLLDQKDLLRNRSFLSQLLDTIRRADLLSLLEVDSGPQSDSSPILSEYRVMLYNLYDDMTEKSLKNMKFLLGSQMGRGQIELCTTALDVFALMENGGQLSCQRLDPLHNILLGCDSKLAKTLETYMNGTLTSPTPPSIDQPRGDQDRPHVSMDNQRVQRPEVSPACSLSVPEMRPHTGHTSHHDRAPQSLVSDADPDYETTSSPPNSDFYELRYNPRGECVVINNEKFPGTMLRNRPGTQQDEDSLRRVFQQLGFRFQVHSNLTANDMRRVLADLGKRSFVADDLLVVCVLSHGELDCVFGADGRKVTLAELRRPFTSKRALTLAGKPKLFFIQACQGSGYQQGAAPCQPRPQEEEEPPGAGWMLEEEEEEEEQQPLPGAGWMLEEEEEEEEQQPLPGAGWMLEEDAGPLPVELVAEDADFLMGMATVEEYKSFRNTSSGSIFIQELCKQLLMSAESNDDLLTTLTRVNREVSKGDYLSFKQMPQPKYTLTKKLVLTLMEVVRH